MSNIGSDGPGQSVRTGLWKDYSTGELQFVVSDSTADILKALVAVWLGLIAPYVLRLLQYCFLKFLGSQEAQTQEERQPILSNGNANGNATSPPLRWQTPSDVFIESKGSRELFARAVTYWRHSRNPRTLSLFLILLVVFLSFLARTVGGVFSAFVATNTVALWHSEECGPYAFDSINAPHDIAARADVYDREKETRAGDYAKYCYRDSSSSTTRPLHCNFFTQQTIPFVTTYSFQCPFPKQDVCAGAQAVTFDTELIDASLVGINDPYGFKFRRSATCVPLSTEAPYVINETDTTVDGSPAFSYLYGERNGTKKDSWRKDTFHSTDDPFFWLAPTYDVSAQSTYAGEKNPYWTPIPALTPPPNNTITIMFINALHILYLRPSLDPIFVADTAVHYKDGRSPVYYCKDDAKYRVLSCLDTQEICLPNGGPCRPLKGDERDLNEDLPPEYWILKWSLEHSNMYYSIAKRLGTALVAQDMISQYTSVPLGDRHWVVEAERLFATSLARIQYDVWSVGSGEDRIHVGEDGYRGEAPEKVKAKGLCGRVKFRSTGHTNISVWKFCLLMAATPLLWLFNLRETTVLREWKWVTGRGTEATQQDQANGADQGVKTVGRPLLFTFLAGIRWVLCNPKKTYFNLLAGFVWIRKKIFGL
ncbi:hypothetical protein OQA88_31 [Cercophora sp. LCS_1]